MGSLRAHIALLLIGYGFLCVFVDRGEAQGGPGGQSLGQNQGQQQGGPQNMGTSANGFHQRYLPFQAAPTCIVPLGVNAKDIRGPNHEYIMNDDPCVKYRDNLYSKKNRQRRLDCRKAADRMWAAVSKAKLNCLDIYHGQCIRNDATGMGACYVLVRRARYPNSFFLVLLDSYCKRLRLQASNNIDPPVNASNAVNPDDNTDAGDDDY
nr:PREDICTED: uncharacterized protein LOC109041622 isoform X2 [Bemisia tabaci]